MKFIQLKLNVKKIMAVSFAVKKGQYGIQTLDLCEDPPLSWLVLPAQLRLACEQALHLGKSEKSRESSTREQHVKGDATPALSG